jgi:hypothetical protein
VQRVTQDSRADAECSVGLRPAGWLAAAQGSRYNIGDFAIHIDVFSQSLDGACDAIIVCRDSNGWYFLGRAGTRTDGSEVRRGTARLIRGTVETGSYLKGGGYTGSAEGDIAVLSEGKRLLRFLAAWQFDNRAVFDEIVRRASFK